MFFDISLIPLAVLLIVGQLKKAPPRLLNNPGYQKEREQVLKHRRILDTLGVGFRSCPDDYSVGWPPDDACLSGVRYLVDSQPAV